MILNPKLISDNLYAAKTNPTYGMWLPWWYEAIKGVYNLATIEWKVENASNLSAALSTVVRYYFWLSGWCNELIFPRNVWSWPILKSEETDINHKQPMKNVTMVCTGNAIPIGSCLWWLCYQISLDSLLTPNFVREAFVLLFSSRGKNQQANRLQMSQKPTQ